MKFYRYLFFRLYSVSLRNGEQSSVYAFTFVYMLALANLFTIMDVISIVSKFKFVAHLTGYVSILFIVSFYFLLYMLLVANGKKEAALKEFQNEEKQKKRIRTLLLWVYAIVTCVLVTYTSGIVRRM